MSADAAKREAGVAGKAAARDTPDAEAAFDPKKHEELARAIAQLSPEQAGFFLWKLEHSIKKRRIHLTGYLVALVAWLAAMMFALAWYGMSDGFVGWVFLLPFALVGLILVVFGRWGDAVGARKPPPELDIRR